MPCKDDEKFTNICMTKNRQTSALALTEMHQDI